MILAWKYLVTDQNQVIKTTKNITGTIYKASSTSVQSPKRWRSHSYSLPTLLPSDKRYRSIRCCTIRLHSSFTPEAVRVSKMDVAGLKHHFVVLKSLWFKKMPIYVPLPCFFFQAVIYRCIIFSELQRLVNELINWLKGNHLNVLADSSIVKHLLVVCFLWYSKQ